MLNSIPVAAIEREEKVRKIAAIASRYFLPILFILLLTILRASAASAACHVITPNGSGSKSGADWNNAMAGVPSNLVRGDTYYFATGNYSALSPSTPDSGSTLITLTKARQAAHCTDTGYNDAIMGQGQAVFPAVQPTTDYWVFDGADSATPTSGHGFYIDGTDCTVNFCPNFIVDHVAGITLKYTAIQGMGDAGADVHINENVRCISATRVNLLYSYIYNSSDAPVLLRGCTNFKMDHTWLFHNRSTTTNHGEGISDSGSSNITVSNSVFWDIEGTSAITELGSPGSAAADNWNIYGNLFFYSPNNANARKGYGDGVISVINNQQASNWYIYNNTFANITASMTLNMRVSFTQSTGSGRYIYNNLWYNCAQADHNGSPSADYNTYLNTDPKGRDTGTHSVIQVSGAVNPFVSILSNNYQLLVDTATGTNTINSLLLNNTDPNNNKRGAGGNWDRGAFQFSVGTAQGPAAPTGLQASVL
jgi:hypothetical protein